VGLVASEPSLKAGPAESGEEPLGSAARAQRVANRRELTMAGSALSHLSSDDRQ
jgi:hypothetical protein